MSVPCPSYLSLALDPTIPPNAKAVYVAVVELIEVEDVTCTYARLTDATGLRGSTLQRAVAVLEGRGLVRRVRCGNGVVVQLVTGDQSAHVCSENSEHSEHRAHPESVQKEESSNTLYTSEHSEVYADLVGIGVRPSVAKKLVSEHSEHEIRSWIAESALRADRNQAGYLVKALREGWVLPAYYSQPFTTYQIAEAVFRASPPEEQRRLVREAHQSENTSAKEAREIARGLPQLRKGLDAAAAVCFLAAQLEAQLEAAEARKARKAAEVEPLEVHEPTFSELWESLASEVPRG